MAQLYNFCDDSENNNVNSNKTCTSSIDIVINGRCTMNTNSNKTWSLKLWIVILL